ncbi:DoxX family protein [Rhodococcus koreensis]|uniref:DoxX protein n=1 Tax=Rhodococcus koreensis TaxID=99653 RepID=A0A1H4MAF1_9NOCA|nr:DoxX family protein [Rhodococcus koreensis]QSE84602.1 DoxX family protein [Rhodococcus koreensis]SEB79999.1 DoxX protein [Rhodococcus koreensis]
MKTATLLRVGARIATGSTYAVLGWDALRTPGARVQMATGALDAIRKILPLPQNDELIVRGNASVQAVGGSLLAVGVYPRASALALVLSLIPTTIAGHNFWAIDDPAARKLQRTQFHKNVAMFGGLLFAMVDSTNYRRAPAPKTQLAS